MVKATNVDLSLDDIISKTRKTKNTIAKKPIGGRRGGRQVGGGIRRRPDGWKDLDDVRNRDVVSSGSGNKIVRVSLSNLAKSVIATDLDELFGAFGLEKANVNYNEHGESLGTAEITLTKRDAERLIKQYAGVALDGKIMKFAIIDGSSMTGRVDFGNRRPAGGPGPRRSGGFGGGRKFASKSKPEDFLRDGVHEGETRRGGAGKGRGGRGGRAGRDEKPKKTEEQLDAELEAYMSKRNA